MGVEEARWRRDGRGQGVSYQAGAGGGRWSDERRVKSDGKDRRREREKRSTEGGRGAEKRGDERRGEQRERRVLTIRRPHALHTRHLHPRPQLFRQIEPFQVSQPVQQTPIQSQVRLRVERRAGGFRPRSTGLVHWIG